MGLFGGGNTTSSTTNNAYDQRQVTDASNGGLVAGAGAGVSVSTSSTMIDNSNDPRVVLGLAQSQAAGIASMSAGIASMSAGFSTGINSAAAGLSSGLVSMSSEQAKTQAAIAGMVTGTVRDIAGSGSDTVATLANLGAKSLQTMGAAATDIYSQAANNAATSWTHTIDKEADVMGRMFDASTKTLQVGQSLAATAMSTYQPADAKMGDAFKWAAVTVAVMAGLAFLSRGNK